MAVRVITGPPGTGKTLTLTEMALEEFKNINRGIKKKNYIWYNSIYSNYPILLKKSKKKFFATDGWMTYESIPIKQKIADNGDKYYSICSEEEREYYGLFSNKIKLNDMRIKWKFTPLASFYIDEIQYIYDSMEYNDFPDCIAHFFQVHRHLDYNMIWTNSQSISRIIKRVLCVSEEFWNIIGKISVLKLYYRLDFAITTNIVASKSTENDLIDNPNIEYYRKRFWCKKVNNAYLSKYLNQLNNNLPKYDISQWNSMLIEKRDIIRGFIVSREEKEELKRMIF